MVCFLIGLIASVLIGWIVVGAILTGLAKTTNGWPDPDQGDRTTSDPGWFRIIDLWLGGTERAVIFCLCMYAPTLVPVFVGGWTVLKYAGAWKDELPVEKQRILLIGSVFSYAVAISIAAYLKHDLFELWQ